MCVFTDSIFAVSKSYEENGVIEWSSLWAFIDVLRPSGLVVGKSDCAVCTGKAQWIRALGLCGDTRWDVVYSKVLCKREVQ